MLVSNRPEYLPLDSNWMRTIISHIGILRPLLVLSCLILSAIGPFATPTTENQGWPLLLSIVAPSITVMIAFTLVLDIAMAFVYRADSSGLQKEHLSYVIIVEVICLVLIFSCWATFIHKVLLSSLP